MESSIKEKNTKQARYYFSLYFFVFIFFIEGLKFTFWFMNHSFASCHLVYVFEKPLLTELLLYLTKNTRNRKRESHNFIVCVFLFFFEGNQKLKKLEILADVQKKREI